jgi:hypothetical protein
VTTGEGMQPGCLMKIHEAERWQKGTNFHEVAFLQQQQDGSDASAPHPGARKLEGCDTSTVKTWLPTNGVTLLLKATLPSHPQPSWTESSPTRSRFLPLQRGGWVPRVMQAGPGQKKPDRRARSAQRPSGYKHSSTIARTSG